MQNKKHRKNFGFTLTKLFLSQVREKKYYDFVRWLC